MCAVRLEPFRCPQICRVQVFSVDKCNLDPLLNYKFVTIISQNEHVWG